MVLVFHYKNYMSKSVCEIVLPFFGKTKFLRVQRTRFLPQLLYLELFSFQCATRSGASLWKNPFVGFRLRFDLSVKIMAFSVFCTAVVYAVNSGCAVLLERTMVEMRRVELLTPCLQGRCSPN